MKNSGVYFLLMLKYVMFSVHYIGSMVDLQRTVSTCFMYTVTITTKIFMLQKKMPHEVSYYKENKYIYSFKLEFHKEALYKHFNMEQ